jgi:hypothetical protein
MIRAIASFMFALVWASAHASESAAPQFDLSHSAWNSLLEKYVVIAPDGVSSSVRYAGLQSDHANLTRYLATVSNVTIAQYFSWSKRQRLAFLINAYNAFTVELVLTQYPHLRSIRDLGSMFRSPWKRPFFHLLGAEHDLDFIEHTMIRAPGQFDDPRIHFSLVCASIGCPMLRNEAFTGERLDEQLNDSLHRFLSDRSRNRFDAVNGSLKISSIFRWYRADFSKGHHGFSSLESLLAQYADDLSSEDTEKALIRNGHFAIEYLPYNWKLNDVR